MTKKDKPYITCDPCGVQVFVRGPAGIREFNRLLEATSGESLLERMTQTESQYRLTCPKCGKKFWVTPSLVKTSVFDARVQGLRCPERRCGGIAPWGENEQ